MQLAQRSLMPLQSFGGGQSMNQSGININFNFGNQPLNGNSSPVQYGKAGKNSKMLQKAEALQASKSSKQMQQLMQMMKQLMGALGGGQGGRAGCCCCGGRGAQTVINNFFPGRGGQGAFF